MKRSLVVFVALGLMTGLVGCGGSGINAEGNQDKAFVITEFIAETEFPGTRAEAGCVLDRFIEEYDLTYAEFRAAIEGGPGVVYRDLGDEDDFDAIFIRAAIDCGVNPFG